MFYRLRFSACIVALLLMTLVAAACRPAAKEPFRDSRFAAELWREDIMLLRTELPHLHPALGLDSGQGASDFAGCLERLYDEVEQLTTPEILVRIMRAVAAVDQAHLMPVLNLGYPVMLTQSGQDVVVRGATREFSELLGAKCTVVHGIPADQLARHESPSGVLLSMLIFPDRRVQPGSFSFVLPSGHRRNHLFERLAGNEEWVWANDLEGVFEIVELEIQLLPEGCYVAGAKGTNAHLVRSRVVSVDAVPVTDLLELMKPLIPAGFAEVFCPLYVRSPQVLRGLGIDGAPDAISYDLLGAAGNEIRLTLRPEQTPVLYTYGGAQRTLPIYMSGPDGGYLSGLGRGYWTRILPGDPPVLYLRLGSCDEDQAASFAALAAALWAEYDTKGCDRIILDLRCSSGWSAKAVQPFTLELDARAELGHPVPLYIIADRSTAPAAAEAAAEMRAKAETKVIGEAVGYAGIEYSGAGKLCLPNSGLEVMYPLEIIRSREPRVLMPDIEVLVSAAEYFTGGDPLLTRAKELR